MTKPTPPPLPPRSQTLRMSAEPPVGPALSPAAARQPGPPHFRLGQCRLALERHKLLRHRTSRSAMRLPRLPLPAALLHFLPPFQFWRRQKDRTRTSGLLGGEILVNILHKKKIEIFAILIFTRALLDRLVNGSGRELFCYLCRSIEASFATIWWPVFLFSALYVIRPCRINKFRTGVARLIE
ncbi:hypothetical protein K439DRAFT_486418 [Ramaria rubella]|nr:hypothetical protein K439DRAFT_486418 [Ramaria rubella]